ncbi:MAG: hypothetical protein JXA94_01570, partial [Parachlamydiales bacterium]|nr:hypothetical protein [Parachlamydiales bacterium]
MKQKILISIFLVFLSIFGIYKLNKKSQKDTFLKVVSKPIFHKKLQNYPKWMDEQIKNDFLPFLKNKISESAIEKTFNQIREKIGNEKYGFVRYRVINNKIYAYLSENKKFPVRQFSFEKALRTLSKVTILPDLDIIYSDEDGTPMFFQDKDFYLTGESSTQAPVLSRAKMKNANFVILIPDYHCLSYHWKNDISKILDLNSKNKWEEKNEIAFWRGANRRKSRYLLSMISQNNSGLLDAGICSDKEKNLEIGKDIDCKNLTKEFASVKDHFKYKYLPTIDGFMCTYSGYQWRLLSNSVAFKQESDEVQWFYSALKPYEHYVPIKDDMSDVIDQINWAIKNDDKCKKIA